ncbi:acetylornithine aminotransferase [Nowakowskiella sp. JEL0407]|nr:acetylornithine aminotransferase [Nowakowskiella sp. JEL0407]
MLKNRSRFFLQRFHSSLSISHPDSAAHPSTASRVEFDSKYLLQLYGQPNLYFSHGSGCYLYDISNRKYLDLSAGIAVTALGHSHPAVTKAITDQAGKLIHLSNLYKHEHAGELAKMLIDGLDKTRFGEGTKVFFCNSGTEANEAAFKFAKKFGNQTSETKHGVLSFGNAFHGRTLGALSATPNAKYQNPFRPLLPGFITCDFNDLETTTRLITEDTCGVIVEPVQGEGGIHVATPEFLAGIRKRCDEVGAVLIFDEIQAGLGRTGKLFSHQHFPSITPDIITLAKPLANGIPIGAVILSPKIASIIKPGDHGTTFGGSPFATAVAKTVYSLISRASFLHHVTETGEYLMESLRKLIRENHFGDIITEIRGKGLIVGMQVKEGVDPNSFVHLARERGVLVITASGNTIRMVPPLIISKEEVDEAVSVFKDVLKVIKSEQK